jgi:hypothetical protein
MAPGPHGDDVLRMNVVHAHLILNHVPIAATFLAAPLLAFALWRLPNRDTWLSATFLLVVGGVTGAATLFTGEGAEEAIEGRPEVSEARMEEHEEHGKVAAAASIVTGVASLAAWGLGRRAPKVAIGATLAVTVVSAALLAYAGNTGGLIRHPEILGPQVGPMTR